MSEAREDLAAVVARDLDLYVDSLDSLEVLVLLFRERGRSWTPDQVADRLRISAKAARRELERLRGKGLAGQALADAFQLDLTDPERAAAAARIAATYGSRRIEIINYVATQTLKRVQSIADAFRLKKDGD